MHDPQIDSVDTSGHTIIGKYNEQVNVANLALVFRYGPQTGPTPASKDGKDKDRSK